MKKYQSISAILSAATGILMLMLISSFAISAKEAFNKQRAASHFLSVVSLTREILLAGQSLRMEQGAVSTALLLPQAASETTRIRLKALHGRSAAALDAISANLGNAQAASGVAAIRKYRLRYNSLFAQAMSAIRFPAARRSANLHEIWAVALTDLIGSAAFQSNMLSSNLTDMDAYAGEMLKTGRIAWQIRTSAGTDRRLLATIIQNARGLSADDRLQFARFTGDIDAPWDVLQRDAMLPTAPAELKAAVAGAKKAYFSDTRKIRRMLINQLEEGRASSLSASQFMTAGSPGLDSIANVSMTALALAEAHVAQQAAVANRSLRISIAFILLSIAIASLILFYIRARVIKPLRLITRTMQTVTQGDLACPIPMQDRQDEMGQFARALCLFRDGALERQRLMSELAQNQSARETAEAASRIKSEFLANMSHELRTPLNAILGFSEIISTEEFGPGLPRYREYATDIHGAGKHLLALINDILDISKAEAGKFDLHLEQVDLADLIRESARLMRDRAAAQDLRISLAIAPLPLLFIDRLRTKQILLNLLSNAIKFTPEGGVISIASALDESGRVVICVRDSGIGIAPEMIPLAFEPFRQIDSSLARKFEGSGLGLSLVKSLIELHGGDVRLESVCGKGTSVYVSFPKSRCMTVAAARSA